MPEPSSESTTFLLSPRRRFGLYAGAAALLAIPGGLLLIGAIDGADALLGAGALVGLVMAPFAVYLIFAARFPRLIVRPHGLDVRAAIGLGTLSIPFEQIERLRFKPGGEGLVLREPLQVRAAQKWANYAGARYNGVPMYDDEQQVLIAEQRYVPIQGYAYWFERGLLSAIGRHAPALVEGFGTQQPAIEQERRSNRRVLAAVFGVSGLISAGAIAYGLFEDRIPARVKDNLGRADEVIWPLLAWLLAAGVAVYGLVNVRASWRLLLKKQFGASFLWAAMAVVQFLIALAIVGSVIG